MNLINLTNLKIGDSLGPLSKIVSTEAVIRFNEIWEAGDKNQFIDAEVAERKGLPGVIVPGIMCIGYIELLLVMCLQKVTIKEIDVSFQRVIIHGSKLEVQATVTDIVSECNHKLLELDLFVYSGPDVLNVLGRASVVAIK